MDTHNNEDGREQSFLSSLNEIGKALQTAAICTKAAEDILHPTSTETNTEGLERLSTELNIDLTAPVDDIFQAAHSILNLFSTLKERRSRGMKDDGEDIRLLILRLVSTTN